jgi:hypothetical protein
MMDKELIDQLWNRATRETLNSGALNERYRFAELVAGHEREACAKVCDERGQGRFALEHYAALTYAGATHDCAAAIRARGND